MNQMTRGNKIKVWMVLIHFVALFTPIYKASFLGASISRTVRQMDAGIYIVIVFAGLLLWNWFALRYRERFVKVTQYIQIGAMGLLLIYLLIAYESGSTIAVSFYIQIFTIGIYVLLAFAEEVALNFFDKLGELRDDLLKSTDALFKESKDQNGKYDYME